MSERSHRDRAEFDLSGGARFTLAAWTAGHGQAAFSSLGRLARRPIASVVTTLVIAVALSLPLALYIMLDNAHRAMRVVDRSAQLTVFLRHDLDEKRTASVASALREWDAVERARIVSRSEALAEYQRMTGFDDVLTVFEGRNPLPDSIVVTPRGGEPDRAALIALRDRMLALAEVDSVQLDLEWVDRLAAIIETLRRVVQVLFAMLGLGILLIVGNTIRLGIESRREEIGIVRLFGATNAFVRRPFLYTGLWYGLTGGAIACATAAAAARLVADPVERLVTLYSSDFALIGLQPASALAVIAAGGLLGLGGAWLAVSRELAGESAVR